MNQSYKKSPWAWVPTLYFAQGLPYVAVMTIAVVMYKNLGMSNSDIAFYTGWLYLPWVIKPLWSPFVDLIKTKRFWIIAMQFLVAAGFAGVAFFIPTTFYLKATLAFFWLLAFSSATHDIAADGFYMLGLSSGDQAFFVGIRNTFYRLATIFGQGILVMLAGLLAEGKLIPSIKGNVPLAWSLIFFILAALFIGFSLYHSYILPKPLSDESKKMLSFTEMLRDFGHTFITFFQKKDVLLMFFFILTYRLGEAQLTKIAPPFLLDTLENGGLNMSTSTYGLIYGTLGVALLLLGGIVGGILISRHGLKRWIVPMALMINIPDVFYVVLAYYQPNVSIASVLVVLEQFGYGFGFTAYMLYLINIAEGEYKTAHYAIATGFMALGMMLPSMISGWIQEQLGYTLFFIWVCICTIPSILASMLVGKKLDPTYGKKVD
ncbi:MAG TPA: MFS transporter [Paludibacteraceae bacterium]|jgi:PAT family beta-lactamase induction signal transducer AmpG|nr:MFS transporter [Paludibacteraceae bacterium]HQB69343.1 MFS transporter [Paludibacteraceae bacterium]HRS67581.1 MFS transporter [Paludibacteraceae bacterium]